MLLSLVIAYLLFKPIRYRAFSVPSISSLRDLTGTRRHGMAVDL
jgi:hypothetical protein